jgi:hypothetical protein
MVDLKQLLPLPEVRGVLDRVKQDPDLEFINSMARKYLGVNEHSYHQPGDERVVVYVKPRHVTYMG